MEIHNRFLADALNHVLHSAEYIIWSWILSKLIQLLKAFCVSFKTVFLFNIKSLSTFKMATTVYMVLAIFISVCC